MNGPDLNAPELRRADLHLHTDRSDGRFPADEVIARCIAGGLDVVAITDHDLAPALEPGTHHREGRTVRLLGAAELSGHHDGTEQHLLVYFAGAIPEGFRSFCRDLSKARAARYDTAVRNLGVPLPPADAAAHAGDRALTRHHLAVEMVRGGHARDLRAAFSGPLHRDHGRVPSVDLAFVEAIRIARGYGGVTSWAHPSLDVLSRYLPAFAAAGLHAVEGLRPRLSARERRVYRRTAEKYGLFLTGGSDWHGWHEPAPGLFYVESHELRPFFGALEAAA